MNKIECIFMCFILESERMSVVKGNSFLRSLFVVSSIENNELIRFLLVENCTLFIRNCWCQTVSDSEVFARRIHSRIFTTLIRIIYGSTYSKLTESSSTYEGGEYRSVTIKKQKGKNKRQSVDSDDEQNICNMT